MPQRISQPPGTSVSVVIPNLNGARWLPGCLASLKRSAHQPLEVIVSDDGSTDQSAAIAAEHGARFLPGSGAPSGFARTANRGLRAARGASVFLLNNDTEVPAETLGLLIAAADEAHADVVSPLVLSMRQDETVDSAGLLLFRDGTGRPRLHGRPQREAPRQRREILLPIGTAMLVTREILDRIGGFDEAFDSYVEDLEWGLRAARAGARTILAPEATVLHWFSGTAGTLSPYKARRVERNHVVVAIRHLPLEDVLLLPFWTVARWTALAALALRGRSEPGASGASLALAALRGAAEGAAAAPGAFRDRRRLKASLPVPRGWRRMLAKERCRLGDFRRFGV